MDRADAQHTTAKAAPPLTIAQFIREEMPLIVVVGTLVLFQFGLDPVLAAAVKPGAANPLLAVLFSLWLFGAAIWAAFGVVRHADALAVKLGEPLGTLVLTLSVVGIEVSLIAAVMLTGADAPTLARDTMAAVLMIVLGGLIGAALLTGGIRHSEQDYNLPGARAYLGVLVPLTVFALVLPRYTVSTEDATFTPMQEAFFAAVTLSLYAIFLAIQTVRHRSYFEQPLLERDADHEAAEGGGHGHGHGPMRSTAYHAAFLILTLLPIVLLSKRIAKLVDFGVVEVGAPAALGGIIIALVVLTPESMAGLAAARKNQLQRSVNLLLGTALATIGLTLPAVLVVSLITGSPLELGLDQAPMVVLMLTLAVCVMTFGGTRTNMLQGAVHLVLFLAYLLLVFSP